MPRTSIRDTPTHEPTNHNVWASILFENKMYTISEPDKAFHTGAYSGSDAHKQEMDLLSYNIASGTTYNWSNYSTNVAQYTENILTQMVTQYSSSLWEY